MLASGAFDHFGKRRPLLGKVTLKRPSTQAKIKGNLCNAWIRIFQHTSYGLFDHLDDFGWIALNQTISLSTVLCCHFKIDRAVGVFWSERAKSSEIEFGAI